MVLSGVHLVPILAAGVSTGTGAVYLAVMRHQAGNPAAWFLVALLVGAALVVYGAVESLAHRRVALLAGGVVLVGTGGLGILSIGLPVLLAGWVCIVAATATRSRPEPEGTVTIE